MKKIRKAVVAAAGFGTRFLPQTKAMPKEMLPLVDKPVIQLIVEQLVEAGIEDIIIVSGYSKRSIEDHFDTPNEDLLNNLRAGGKSKAHYIDEMQRISSLANFIYVRQKGPYGNATPLLNARSLIQDEPFIYTYADDIMLAKQNVYSQMIARFEALGGTILPCIRVNEPSEYKRYGIVGGSEVQPGIRRITSIVEKPEPADAPSDYASVLGYVFEPAVLDYLERGLLELKPGEEFYVTSSLIQPMLDAGRACYGCEIQDAVRYDTGDKLGYLKAVFDIAIERDDVGPELKAYLQKRLK